MADDLRLPLHDLEAETSVLGAILIEPIAMDKIASMLPLNAFYKTIHNQIYRSMLVLYNKGEPVDVITLCDQLARDDYLDKIGGAFYITGLSDAVPSAANIERYAAIVSELYARREIISVSHGLENDAHDLSVSVDDLMGRMSKLGAKVGAENFDHFSVAVDEALSQAHEAFEHGGVAGIPTGIKDYDKMTGGFERKTLVIIAGRPGMGKSALMGQMAVQISEQGYKVAIVSIESSRTEISRRALGQLARVNTLGIKQGKITASDLERMGESAKALNVLPLYIDDSSYQSLQHLKAKARKLKATHGLDVLFIDYLQLLTGSKEDKKAHQIGEYSAGLKAIAKELDICVAALVQLNREPDRRSSNDHRPIISDLRDSGNIEQDADVIMLLYRPSKYGIMVDKKSQRNVSRTCEVIVGKHRDGPTGTVYLLFEEEYVKFVAQADYPDEPPMDYGEERPW